MALQKKTYVDGVTVIPAKNLNDIQDAIIDLEKKTAEPIAGSDVANALKGTAEGNPIRLDDVSPLAHEMAVGVKSKNLLKFPYYDGGVGASKTANGVTWTVNEDGSITANGTPSGFTSFVFARGEKLPKETFTISVNSASGVAFEFILWDDNETTIHSATFYDKLTINPKDYPNATKYRFYVCQRTNGVAISSTFTVQIEEGTTATAYTPYVDVSGATANMLGKNLLPVVPYESSKTVSGITFTLNDDNSLTIKGTATATVSFYYAHEDSKQYLKKGVYTVSGAVGITSAKGKMVFWLGKEYNLYDGGRQTVSVEEDAYYTLRIVIYSGQTVDTTVYPLLELGNIVSTYSKPIDVHGAFVKKSGKNLFNPSKILTDSRWSLDENGVLSGPAYALHDYYVPDKEPYMTFESIEQLTISCYGRFKEGSTASGLNFVFKYSDGTTQTAIKIMSSEDTYYEFTTPKGKKPVALHFTWGNSNGTQWLHDVQIEASATATAYEPYHSETFTADENGKVEGIIGNGEDITLMGDGVTITAEYNRDLNKAFAELQKAILNV